MTETVKPDFKGANVPLRSPISTGAMHQSATRDFNATNVPLTSPTPSTEDHPETDVRSDFSPEPADSRGEIPHVDVDSTGEFRQSDLQSEISDSDAAETFPLAYVQKLRTEAAEARVKAKRADDLAASLFIERVRATGRMADPSDLPFNADLLDDPDALTAAIDTLLANKPHLASRTPRGNVGQGSTGASGDVDLAALLRAGA